MTVILERFDDNNPVNTPAINANFQAIVAAVNALAGSNVLQLGVLVDDSPLYMPKTGGAFSGQISAPSMVLNGNAVVARGDLASTGLAGLVKAAAAVADLAGTPGVTYQQLEIIGIYAKINALLAALRTAGSLAP